MNERNAEKSPDDEREAPVAVNPEEVDLVIAALNELMERTTSPLVQEILEGACCDLAELVDLEEEDEDSSDGA